jgi:hypothetical protein
MAKITMELFRSDFKLNHWENFEKGYISLSRTGLNTELLDIFIKAHEVFIKLHGKKHYLKRKK